MKTKILSPERHRPGVGRLLAGEQAQQGGFPRSVDADQRHPLSPVDLERKTGEDLDRAVALGEAPCAQDRPAAAGGLGKADVHAPSRKIRSGIAGFDVSGCD